MLDDLLKPYIAQISSQADAEFEMKKLLGDASSREYFRIFLKSTIPAPSIILMKFDPQSAQKSEEAAGDAPVGEFPFISVLKYLEGGGLRVPALLHQDIAAGLVFLEDLGDVQVGSLVKNSDNEMRRKWYKKAIDLLVKFQLHNSSNTHLKDFIGLKRSFTYDLLLWECDHYIEWGIEALYNVKLREPEIWPIQEAFESICTRLTRLPQILVHRDFQSRNMMVLPNEEIALIDFQDALIGPWPYDLVALLRDSYVKLDDDLLDELISYYCDVYEQTFRMQIDRQTFMKAFYLQTLQRKLKDSGRFVFIDRVKKNASYLQFIPNSLSYVKWAFDRLPEFAGLRAILSGYEERLK